MMKLVPKDSRVERETSTLEDIIDAMIGITYSQLVLQLDFQLRVVKNT